MLIGNLTRDPELRYTPTGAAVCTIGLATNRYWTTESGEKKEEVEFHRVVAWNKLAELCSQLLVKGRKIYVEGRLRTNSWKATDGTQRSTTEVVIEDMIILDSRIPAGSPRFGEAGQAGRPTAAGEGTSPEAAAASDSAQSTTTYAQPGATGKKQGKKDEQEEKQEASGATETVNPDDIPF